MERAEPIEITDADDPRIAEFRDIRERDLTGRDKRFIAEGTVVLRVLAQAHVASPGTLTAIRAEKVLLLKNRVAGLADILATLPAEIPVYTADGPVLDAIAGFHLHRGVLALGRRGEDPTLKDYLADLPQKALLLSACGISNHDNIGALFRNAAVFGADGVILDKTCCDPLYRKSLRVSVGSVLALPYLRQGTPVETLDELALAGFAIWALSPRGDIEMREIPASDRMVIVMGTEGDGLPDRVLQRFKSARIAQSPLLDSLNVGTASGIALYHAAMAQGRL